MRCDDGHISGDDGIVTVSIYHWNKPTKSEIAIQPNVGAGIYDAVVFSLALAHMRPATLLFSCPCTHTHTLLWFLVDEECRT